MTAKSQHNIEKFIDQLEEEIIVFALTDLREIGNLIGLAHADATGCA